MPSRVYRKGVVTAPPLKVWGVSVALLSLMVTACTTDITQSEEYQALASELSGLASSQAETERQLADVEGQLNSAEDEMERIQTQLAEAEERAGELEAKVRELEEEADVPRSQDRATNPEGGVTVFGDGEISCPDHRADDESLPVGTVVYEPGPGELRVLITLTNAAQDWGYGVEVWSEESCAFGEPLGMSDDLLETDANGAGELDFVVAGLEPGTYGVNINVSSGGDVPEDPRHREMGTAEFTEVVVP